MEIRIYGRVQFVGFRKKVKKFCIENKIKGYVKNISDGSVLIVCDKKSEKLNDWLRTSPGFSKVEEVKVENFGDKGFENFEIKKEENYFADKLKAFLNLVFLKRGIKKVPVHIAIIPDGNRRWAKKRGLRGYEGHEKAGQLDNVISLFDEAKNLDVKYVSFWGFSTENWKREKEENEKLFKFF